MIKIFVAKAHGDGSPGHELEAVEVKRLNPDRIICWCTQELEYEHIFGKFFNNLETWLESRNKIINLITPHLDQIWVRPRVLAENSCGYLLDYMYYYLQGNDFTDIPWPVVDKNKVYLKLYSCYINRYQAERADLVDNLVRENLLDKGIVTFRYPNQHENWKWHDGTRLYDEEDFTLHQGYIANGFPKSFFTCFFDVVVESRVDKGEFFITEKTLKSVVTFKPFLVFSCAGFHKKYLRDFLKFELYDEIFDYSFDDEDSVDLRIKGIISNIKRLENLDELQLNRLYRQIVKKLYYNKSRLFQIIYDKDLVIPKSGRFLIDGTQYSLHCKSHPVEIVWAQNLCWSTIPY